jgi:uncharacterized membrane protein
MSILLLILAIVGFVYLNSRISSLERLIASGGKIEMPKMSEGSAHPFADTVHMAAPAHDYNARLKEARKSGSSGISGEEAGGRWLGKIGVAAIFIGVAFFLNMAFQSGLIGPVGQVILGIFAGIILLGIGQYLRAKYRVYSDILMGGGVAILYLTIFAASTIYGFIHQPTALFFILIVTALSVMVSMIDGAITMAMIGIIGGFFVPFWVSYNGDSFILLSYILLLDIGVLAISFKQRWHKLTYIAFFGTILNFMAWSHPATLGTQMLFLTLYFIIFLVSSIAHHIFRKEKSNGLDLLLITANALGYFALSYSLLYGDYADFMGFFAVIMAIVYAIVSYLALSTDAEDVALNYYAPGLAILFLTIAVPLQLDGSWVTLAWLIEAVVIMLLAKAVNRPSYTVFAIVVYAVGLVNLLAQSGNYRLDATYVPFINSIFILFVIAIVASYVIASVFKSASGMILGTKTVTLAALFLVVANIITVYAVTYEVSKIFDSKIEMASASQSIRLNNDYNYNGNVQGAYRGVDVNSINNQRNTIISIIWALYAIGLIAFGFAMRSRVFRIFGLVFFFITAAKIFIDVWSLGQGYAVISSIVFGIIALLGSFAYAKYQHRIKEMITE